jgi:hypothetical protein
MLAFLFARESNLPTFLSCTGLPVSEILFVIRNAKHSVGNFALLSVRIGLTLRGERGCIRTTARIAAVQDMSRNRWT